MRKCKHGHEIPEPRLAHDVCLECKVERKADREFRQQLVLTTFDTWIHGGSTEQFYDSLGNMMRKFIQLYVTAQGAGREGNSKSPGAGSDS